VKGRAREKAQGRADGRNEERKERTRSYLHHQRYHVKLLLMSIIRLKAAVRALFVCHPSSTAIYYVRKKAHKRWYRSLRDSHASETA